MKKRISQRKRHKLRISTRLLAVVGAVSITLTLVISWLVYINISNLSRTKASGSGESGGNQLNNNCEILAEFNWEKDPVTHSTLGPDAISAGKSAHVAPGGKSSTRGLAPGNSGKDIDLVIPGSSLFDQDGLDISIDYRRNESSGNFLTRGNSFNFGMEKGYITISYRVDNKSGGYETIQATTDYEIPMDPLFRTYRFMYNPVKGKAEIFVNSVIIWSSWQSPNMAMYWKNAGDITIGKGMDGGAIDIPVFDNLVIRTAGTITPVNESLVNFMLSTNGSAIDLHWSTIANDRVSEFIIQRSVNGVDFSTIAAIKADPNKAEGEEYLYKDRPASPSQILYYRLRQNLKDGKFVIHPLSAVKLIVEKDLCIERVNPLPFGKSFDVSYFTPSSGRMWIQLKDSKGKIRSSETFDVQKGKNIHVYKDRENLESGTYTLNLIFGEKKVSTKVIKS